MALAMGSRPEPHLANAWRSQFDDAINGNSKLCSRYMNDIFCDKKKKRDYTQSQQQNQQNDGLPIVDTVMEAFSHEHGTPSFLVLVS